MNKPLQIAEHTILEPFAISENYLRKIIRQTMSPGVDYADIYLQYSQHESWFLEEGIVKKGHFTIDQGFGVRAISGEKAGFAFSDELTTSALLEASGYAKSIVNSGQVATVPVMRRKQGLELYPAINPLISISDDTKVALLRAIDQEARRCDPRVNYVRSSLTGSYKVILLATSDGLLVADVRPMVSCNVSVVVAAHGKRERGYFGAGARTDYNFFLNEQKALSFAREAVRMALVNLQAVPAPVGVMPVVLGHGWPAVLLHEAVGHGLEADFHRKKTSVYTGKMGQKVASSLCTVIDQGSFEGAKRGSLNIDDEGTLSQATTLIENGILCGLMQDKFNARLMHAPLTGNGRRASYANMPLPRMTTTYFLPGKHDPGEIIASVNKGIYAVNFSGGQVDITSGEFVFSTSEAYLIEKGKITHPVKGATLIGNGPKVLQKITMMGNDLEFDAGFGVCGKDGQNVAVGLGQPTLKVSGLNVGGTDGCK